MTVTRNLFSSSSCIAPLIEPMAQHNCVERKGEKEGGGRRKKEGEVGGGREGEGNREDGREIRV